MSKNSPKDFIKTFKCDVGHTASFRSESISRKHFEDKNTTLASRIHGNPSNNTLHGVPMDIKDDHVGGAFFALYGQVEEVARILSKAGLPTGDFSVQVILDRTQFQ